MDLLERESQLARLGALLTATEHGQGGACVLVSGEAGIGKTSLVRHFTDLHRGRCELLWGACEALFTPRPLGPFLDVAPALTRSDECGCGLAPECCPIRCPTALPVGGQHS